MQFNLKRAVQMLAQKDLKFLQPMYEAVTNSLESNSTEIIIDLKCEELFLENVKPKIIGFTITDNGDGFTTKNINSFKELWSDLKIDLGCKGSGRFTWLNVFNNINIESSVTSENKHVSIPFNIEFDDSSISIKDQIINKNKTIITFSNITNKYYNSVTGYDNRDIADIESIREAIENCLLIKLFLLKKDNKTFSITIKLNERETKITNDSIPNLDYRSFSIYSDITKENYEFKLYYHFIENQKNSKKIYYCANNRIVKEENDDALKFSCELPNKVSFNMLLCSKYLDDMVNDSRDDFPGMADKRQANFACPLRYKDIKPHMLTHMHLILLEKFPELEKANKEQENLAINNSPYLTSYIIQNKDIVKTEKSLTVKALDSFNKHKVMAKEKFNKLLRDKSIDPNKLNESIQELSEVAAAELGEYIFYRQNIIEALRDSINDFEKKEDYIHNIFMPQKTSSNGRDENKHIISNLWLLDDRYMTYAYAASDKSIRAVKNELNKNNPLRFKDLNRPDLLIFFKDEAENKDIVIVELKGANADKDEKTKAITELPDNIRLVRDHFKLTETDQIYSYIITKIDDNLEFTINNQDGYHKLFTMDNNYKIFYKFYEKVNSHNYVIDLEALVNDADGRNSTFLNILKKYNQKDD